MKALYRRYRPKTLDDVVGQDQVTTPLKKALKSGKINHAYLFIGPRGTGKTSVARILAHEINHFDYELEDSYLDIIEIDAASNTGVDNIRDLREKAIIAPTKGKYKVYIIDEVHMLSKSAFNALLKTLEEPPEHVIFIMATTDAYKVPVTITSRSQTLVFKLADQGTMFQHLKKICTEEKIKIDDDALNIVVQRGGGSYRDSLSLLDQVSTLSDDNISAEMLNKALGLPQDEIVRSILTAYAAGDAKSIREKLIELDQMNVKANLIADSLIRNILQNPENIYLGLLDKLTDIGNRSDYPEVKLLLALTAPSAIANANFAMPVARTTVKTSPAAITQTTTSSVATAQTSTSSVATAQTSTSSAAAAPAAIIPEQKPAPAQDSAPTQSSAEPKPSSTEPEPSSAANDIPPEFAPLDDIPPEYAPLDDLPAAPAAPISPTNTEFKAERMTIDNFSINEYKNRVIASFAENAMGAKPYIEQAGFELQGKRVLIYACSKFKKRQIDKYLGLLGEILPNEYEVEVKAEAKQNDAELANIAALMGGGVEVNINE